MNVLPSLVFFGIYAAVLLLHLCLFMVGACLYVPSVALTLLYTAVLLAISPLSLHSAADGWVLVQRERLCGIPRAVWLGLAALGWGALFLINVALLSAYPGVSLLFMLAYGASALLLVGAMATYGVLFICFFAW